MSEEFGRTLNDRVRQALAYPERRLTNGKDLLRLDKRARLKFKNVSDSLFQANQMIVDDDNLTRLMVRFAAQTPETFERMLRAARPPFENLWIEWNEEVRSQAVIDYKYNTSGKEFPAYKWTGFLIRPVTDQPLVYHVSGFHETPNGITPQPIAFTFSPELSSTDITPFESHIADTILKAHQSDLESEAHRHSALAIWLLGQGWVRAHMNLGRDCNIDDYHKVNESTEQVLMAVYRLKEHASFVKAPLLDAIHNREWIYDTIMGASGTLRYLITLVAMINTNSKHIETSNVERTGSAVTMGRNLPYQSYTQMTLKVPAETFQRRFTRALEPTGWHNRHHKVRGHWVYRAWTGPENDTRRPKHCKDNWFHDWKTDEEDIDRHICTVCGYRRTWRTYPKGRGDKEKGSVQTEYKLIANPDADPKGPAA